MTLQEFVDKYNGKKVDWDGNYGPQCFDLFQYYNQEVVGGSFVGGSGAKDIWNTYPKDLYEKIPNTPEGVPQAGDVMIWGSGYGQYGHVAIVTEADVMKFKALSQNDPIGRETHIREYTYDFVLGWLRPKLAVVENNMDSKKAIQFDRVLNYLKEKGYIADNDSNKYLDGEFLDLIKHLYEDYKSNRERAGKWDNICLKAGITTDSNKVSVDQVYEKLYKAEVVSTQSEQLLNLRKENEALSKKLEESIKLVEQKEALRAKWYSLYETSKDNFETCKQGNATLQKKLTECQNKQDFTVGELVVRLWNKVRGIKI